MNGWHNNQLTMIGVLLTLIVSTGAGFYNAGIIKSDVTSIQKSVSGIQSINDRLDDLTGRVIRNEVLISEYGRLILEVKDILKEFNATITKINNEQNRRGPRLAGVEKRIESHRH